MMNNYDERTLLNKISELENENAKLKVENQELKNKLEVQDLVDPDYNKPVSLNDYYLSKYLDTHDEIYKRRLNAILVKSNEIKDKLVLLEVLYQNQSYSKQSFYNQTL